MEQVRRVTHADEAHKLGYIGNGVTVAVMDTGIASHIDFGQRTIGFVDAVYGRKKPYDDNGHGTHVSGIIAGSGFAGRGRYTGMAPGASILSVKVLDRMGKGNTKQVVQALRWLMEHKEEYRVRILNISVGMLATAREEEQKLLLATMEEVWDAGIVVVAAAGNNGPRESSITIPGLCKTIITVGSSDDDAVNVRSLGLMKGYSGRGPTGSCVMKPEIVAPGTAIISCGRNANSYEVKSGTSMATPVVAGAIAVLLEKRPRLKPAEVKLRLYETSVDIGKPRETQGWGRLDVMRLIS
ncbi:MAG: S8 family peptidase [Lachnospiraceae bacterium]|nr:S8 family peptidase [Lachnospiraceae bacterium]MDE7436415.1 S8 family peptidase [Lachnospiraceae bacterium]